VRTLILSRAAYGPHEGRARIIIVKRAEELSTNAANALLKTLEEPLAKTHFVLLTSRPDMLLPTILSRTLRVRFGYLSKTELTQIAETVPGALKAGLDDACKAQTTRALFQTDENEQERLSTFVQSVMRAIVAPSFSPALEIASEAKKERAQLEGLLHGVAAEIASRAKQAVHTHESLNKGPKHEGEALAYAHAHICVLRGLDALDGNVSPQLAIEQMFAALRRQL
jgi:DNA polymerase III subunit delta'